jgi:hypothetical protein
MRIITVKSVPVKATRNSTRQPGRFGAGLLASVPATYAPITAADEAWYVEQQATAEDRRYDEMEAEAIGLARVDLGLCF